MLKQMVVGCWLLTSYALYFCCSCICCQLMLVTLTMLLLFLAYNVQCNEIIHKSISFAILTVDRPTAHRSAPLLVGLGCCFRLAANSWPCQLYLLGSHSLLVSNCCCQLSTYPLDPPCLVSPGFCLDAN